MNPQSNKATWALTACGALFATAALFVFGTEPALVPAPLVQLESPVAVIEPIASVHEHAEREQADGPRPQGFYGAPVGQVMRYDYRADSTVDLRTKDDAAGSSMKVALTGEMAVTVLARQGDELVAEVRFPSTTGTIATNGSGMAVTADDALGLDFARPLLVRLRDDGSTLGYVFAAEVAPQHRNFLRGLWSACRFVARDVDGASYTTVEDDAVGPADLEYDWLKPFVENGRVTGGRLARKKLGYAGDRQADFGKVTAAGYGEAQMNPSLGWFEKTAWEETVVRELVDIGVTMSARLSAHWQLRDLDWRLVDDDASLWQLGWQSAGGFLDAAAAGPDLRYEAQRLADVTLESLLGDLAALLQAEGDPHDVYGKKLDLTLLLQIRPEALAQLRDLLPRLDEATAMLAISAMAATELPAAQAIVAALFADPNQSLSNRQAAAWSMVQVMNPEAATVESFAAAVKAALVHDAGIAEGVLALGTLVGRAVGDTQTNALATLLGLEAVAASSGALPNWIEAVGNTGLAAALAVAQRHAAHGDTVVRAATVSAVRLVAGPEAFEFAVAALGDEAALVRNRAVETIVSRSEPQALAVIETFLQNEPDARVRLAAVRTVAARLPDPAAAGLLQRIASVDADAEVRQVAHQLIAGT